MNQPSRPPTWPNPFAAASLPSTVSNFALADKLAKRFGIRVDAPLAALSGGDQRKVAVLLAFAAQPDLLVLDEPAAGLDPIARRQLMEEIVGFLGDGGERTVLFSTHAHLASSLVFHHRRRGGFRLAPPQVGQARAPPLDRALAGCGAVLRGPHRGGRGHLARHA